MSEEWIPASGLRVGCSTLPTLFSVYQKAAMRWCMNKTTDVVWKWLPGRTFAVKRACGKEYSNATRGKNHECVF